MKACFLILSVLLLSWIQVIFERIELDYVTINEGTYKNFRMYPYAGYKFYNGFRENNLTFKITDDQGNVLIEHDNDSSDAMIAKPNFFSLNGGKEIVILLEIAAEYSWGQDVFWIKNDTIYHSGYINLIVALENGLSIADYCQIRPDGKNLLMLFEDVPLLELRYIEKEYEGKNTKCVITPTEVQITVN